MHKSTPRAPPNSHLSSKEITQGSKRRSSLNRICTIIQNSYQIPGNVLSDSTRFLGFWLDINIPQATLWFFPPEKKITSI